MIGIWKPGRGAGRWGGKEPGAGSAGPTLSLPCDLVPARPLGTDGKRPRWLLFLGDQVCKTRVRTSPGTSWWPWVCCCHLPQSPFGLWPAPWESQRSHSLKDPCSQCSSIPEPPSPGL